MQQSSDIVVRYKVMTRADVLKHRTIRWSAAVFTILAVATAPSPIRHKLFPRHPQTQIRYVVVHDTPPAGAAQPTDWWLNSPLAVPAQPGLTDLRS